jgi:predicted RNA binding protein YcfA (HicA-like mRNA interferase family)
LSPKSDQHQVWVWRSKAKGSHRQFRHEEGRCTTVPMHKGRDISPVLLRIISKDIGMNIQEFLKY